MQAEFPAGIVLVLGDDPRSTEPLCRVVAAAGERPVPLSTSEVHAPLEGSNDEIDLVVTDLDPRHASSLQLLDRLLDGELLVGPPQLHILRQPALRERVRASSAEAAELAMDAPPGTEELRVRIGLAARVGRLRRELARSAIRDPKTGFFNRSFLLLRLEQEFARARRYASSLSIVLMEIDQLEEINRTYGRETGDQAILKISRDLARQIRREDTCGRVSGKSFGVILPGTPYRGAAVFANKVRGDAEAFRVPLGDATVPIKVSAGISSFRARAELANGAELLEAAEQALHEAKKRGGNRVFIDEAVLRSERRVIVIADPEPTLLDLAEDLLSMDDYRVVRAESASTLLEALKYRRPDLLILDLDLAEERLGEDSLIDRVHAMFAETRVPIIGLSRDSRRSEESLGGLGVERYITKPFSVSVLRSVARELVESHRPRPASGSPV